MNLVRYQPRDLSPSDLLDEFLGDFFGSRTALNKQLNTAWKPAVSITEEDDKYVVSADVPGVDPEEIDVTYENRVLTIKGERKSESSTEDGSLKREERYFGSFVRQFTLPDGVDDEAIKAKSANGVLEITLPKLAQSEPKKIAVQ